MALTEKGKVPEPQFAQTTKTLGPGIKTMVIITDFDIEVVAGEESLFNQE